jgi:excisionase family DNA binding protein
VVPETISIDEAAVLLSVARNTAYAAAKRGEIPTIKIGRRMLVPREQIEKMLSEGVAISPAQQHSGGQQIAFRLDARVVEQLRQSAIAENRSLTEEIGLRLKHSVQTVRAIRTQLSVDPVTAS